jgi:hypothetical protein
MPNLRSPSIVVNEIELSVVEEGVVGTPVTVVGVAQKGRAFVPHTVGTQSQILNRFGDITPETPGLHAAYRFLEFGNALTFYRVLGVGEHAGFVLDQADADELYANLTVQPTNYFLSAQHRIPTEALPGLRELDETLNGPYSDGTFNLVRAQILVAAGWSLRIDDVTSTDDSPTRNSSADVGTNGLFRLTLIPPTGDALSYNVDLDPNSTSYIKRVLNTNNYLFGEKGHVLWREWAVAPTIAVAAPTTTGTFSIRLDAPRTDVVDSTVASESGLGESSKTVNALLGEWNNIYSDSVSPWVTSQPFAIIMEEGGLSGAQIAKLTTKRLFRFHTIDDGTDSAQQVKVSISNVRTSTNSTDPFGSFTVTVRRWDDTDFDQKVLEVFPNVNLNPNSERYIARVIGDRDFFQDWSRQEGERRLTRRGTYSNNSTQVWVEVHPSVEDGDVDASALPFGYESPYVQRVNDGVLPDAVGVSILPPLFRKKVTVSDKNPLGPFAQPARGERIDTRLHWGLQWEMNDRTNVWNRPGRLNPSIESLCAYAGRNDNSQLLEGKEASHAFESEFSLAFVTLNASNLTTLRALSPATAMRSAYYLRGNEILGVESTTATFFANDGSTPGGQERVSFATLLTQDRALFNRYSGFMQFTLPLQGGWDGLNPFWRESANMTDRASGVTNTFAEDWTPGFNANVLGEGDDNIVVQSLLAVAKNATDSELSDSNVLVAPGWREPLIVDEYSEAARESGYIFYIADVPAFDETNRRIWTGERRKPDVSVTINEWVVRNIDNNFVGAYFPDVVAPLPNNRGVVLPASVAALVAFGLNDRDAYPWFAPAGFNRGALNWVNGTVTKLRKPDRDDLYDDARINPIFSGTETDNTYAILGQKTLQLEATALDRINVRRAVIEAKKILRDNMLRYALFEPNDAETRALFVQRALEQLEPLKQLAGARSIRVICDETNNSPQDVLNRVIRATCVFVPVRVAENIIFDVFISPDGDFSSIER